MFKGIMGKLDLMITCIVLGYLLVTVIRKIVYKIRYERIAIRLIRKLRQEKSLMRRDAFEAYREMQQAAMEMEGSQKPTKNRPPRSKLQDKPSSRV